MRNPVGAKIIAAALAVKRLLAIRTRFYQLRFWLWRQRYGVRPVRNFIEDLKWGGSCGGFKRSPYANLGANDTQSIHYDNLSYLFGKNNIPIHDNDVLVDVGCGKGRVINFWLGRGCRNRIIGIELDEEIANVARKRLARYPNVEIITGDATQVMPVDGTLFFLFNPFGPEVMHRFMERLKQCPGVCIIYFYCRFVDIFKNDPWWSVEDLRTGDHKPGVLIRPKAAVTAERDGLGAGGVARGTASQGQKEQPVAAQSRG